MRSETEAGILKAAAKITDAVYGKTCYEDGKPEQENAAEIARFYEDLARDVESTDGTL